MRLIILSNRLPFTVTETNGTQEVTQSNGGLATGLNAFLHSQQSHANPITQCEWIGWPGITCDEETAKNIRAFAPPEYSIHPVLLAEREMEKFYYGFCNRTIWPLFHYFPTYATYNDEFWANYKSVNETFRDAALKIIKPGDLIWVHDYHLMLLPAMLRNAMPEATIGFFLHVPFPSFELFRLLPSAWRNEILRGMLGADLIGFHTHDYTQYFLRCVLRILGYEHNMGEISMPTRIARADTFPMGIDFHKFFDAATGPATGPEIMREKRALAKALPQSKIILSIDRLDYSKGILHRLRGYTKFLEHHPEWHEKVSLILVVVPSRIGVYDYERMKRRIDETVGNINGTFGTVRWMPIVYQFRATPFHQLSALYASSDIALLTPLRDGMNLIAKEYIASRTDKTGVLILSEMAGAAKELGEAAIVNPNDIREIADAIANALEMPRDEQIRRNAIMQKRLRQYDVARWGEDFLHHLRDVKTRQKIFDIKLLSAAARERLVKDYRNARRRLLLLDYDGTLVSFHDSPEHAKPSTELLDMLAALASDPANELAIISGRDMATLDEWFGDLPIHIIGEHGACIKDKSSGWQFPPPAAETWKSKIQPILETYVARLPGSFIEEKNFSFAFHFRQADTELAAVRTKEMVDNLVNFTANLALQVLQGNKVVEIRNSGVNKGNGVMYLLVQDAFDFILAAGDDWTDEDMFAALPPAAHSIKIGITQSKAQYNLHDSREMIELLRSLVGSGAYAEHVESASIV